ncbi:MAG: 2OG-Fe(II) oxygenase [Parvularculaceae bacterium]|nr:2OG-Fe(II) oxygenase [Parvularculaceae bacterium]
MTAPDTNEILRRAEAGDAGAQYALAAMYAGRKQTEQSRLWLERAAENGHADALFTLSSARLSGVDGLGADTTAALAGLREAHAKGSLAALRMLAALTAAGRCGGAADWRGALSMMREAVDAGDAPAKREIAALLLGRDPQDADGAHLLGEAAQRDPLAAALVERRRRRGRASLGALSLDRAFGKLAGLDCAPDCAPDPIPEREVICGRPRIGVFRAAAGGDLCDHLIGAALARLERQEIVDDAGVSRVHPHRRAMGAALGFGHLDLPAAYAGLLMARLAGAPHIHGESVMILRYQPGDEYRPHHDFLGPDEPDLQTRGQRVRTALLYLNEDYRGGETHFLAPDIAFSGGRGDILVFDNVDDAGAPDVAARHAGRPVLAGEKWLASLWFRDRPYMR